MTVDEARGATPAESRVRLGHISYSNCFPVHSRFIDLPKAGDPELVVGVPSALNTELAEGRIDLAPCSSIEYARHSDVYRILPDLVIGARGPVRSIVFASQLPPTELSGKTVAVPNASATSVVLLKILLRDRWQAETRFRWFDQRTEDPFDAGASAALFIGDVALNGIDANPAHRFDLGSEWWDHTGLPFAFAIWQAGASAPEDLRPVHRQLLESREYGLKNRQLLASRYARHFGLDSQFLASYWGALSFDLDNSMVEGLSTFYRLAAEIGEIESAPELRWI